VMTITPVPIHLRLGPRHTVGVGAAKSRITTIRVTIRNTTSMVTKKMINYHP
jgi:hypothetical protein